MLIFPNCLPKELKKMLSAVGGLMWLVLIPSHSPTTANFLVIETGTDVKTGVQEENKTANTLVNENKDEILDSLSKFNISHSDYGEDYSESPDEAIQHGSYAKNMEITTEKGLNKAESIAETGNDATPLDVKKENASSSLNATIGKNYSNTNKMTSLLDVRNNSKTSNNNNVGSRNGLSGNMDGTVLSEEDFRQADELDIGSFQLPMDENGVPNDPTLKSGYFEGDIIGIGKDDMKISRMFKAARIGDKYKWPGGVVPYKIDPDFQQHQRLIIARAIQEYDKNTCVKFRAKNESDNDYVYFTKGTGCGSLVGKQGYRQDIELSAGCFLPGIIMHEMLHAIGFMHEQSRTDRDNYINIKTENVLLNEEHNFQKYHGDDQDLPYDLCSIMHYGPYAFSKNFIGATIEVLVPHTCTQIGQRISFSPTDILRINKRYECPEKKPNEADQQEDQTMIVLPPVTEFPVTRPPCVDAWDFCDSLHRFGKCDKDRFPNEFMYTSVKCAKTCNSCDYL